MNWYNPHDTPIEDELRQERDTFHDNLLAARNTITKLRRQLAAQHEYIEELEKQLEPSVIEEIRYSLSEEEGK
jgi:uncharacterized coiled-coil DUF342 family protein